MLWWFMRAKQFRFSIIDCNPRINQMYAMECLYALIKIQFIPNRMRHPNFGHLVCTYQIKGKTKQCSGKISLVNTDRSTKEGVPHSVWNRMYSIKKIGIMKVLNNLLLAACAHTMKAFIGLFTWILFLSNLRII